MRNVFFGMEYRAQTLRVKSVSFYLATILFVAGNIALPQICHLVPSGGMIFLPIYFFTLIAAYRYGIFAGVATGLLSPLANNLLFGMPPHAMLPVILVKSVLLASGAAYIAKKSKKLSLVLLAAVVLFYQLFGGAFELVWTNSIQAPLADLTLGVPGLLLQIGGGYMILWLLSRNDHKTVR